jgi:hypothetical protein
MDTSEILFQFCAQKQRIRAIHLESEIDERFGGDGWPNFELPGAQ